MCKENIICVFQDNKPVEFILKFFPVHRSASKSSPLLLSSPTVLYKETEKCEQSADVSYRVYCSPLTYLCTKYLVILTNVCINLYTEQQNIMNVFSVLGQEDPEYQWFWGDTVGMEIR